jgi:uncharacterized protein
MLTADLVRYRIDGDSVRPSYILRRRADGYLALSDKLIRLFQNHVGKPRTELESALENLEASRTDYKIIRGLVKLLEERGDFRPERELDYPAFRRTVFEKACRSTIVTNADLFHEDKRLEVLAEAASEFGLNPSEAEDCLYGDLPENRILVGFEDSFTPEALLKRYNLALAQGLLYRALGMRIRLSGDYRIVFRHVKLARLIHRISSHPEGGYDVRLDGPASLFRNTERYGIRMSAFLPALLLAKDWDMTADIRTREGIKQFRLDPDCGLASHYTPLPEFDSKAEVTFFDKFNRKDRDWIVEREGEVIDLGDAVMIPDFTFRHPDGRIASLEIIGFWTPEYLRQKMEKIQKAGRRNLFLAVNRMLNCGKEKFDGPVFYYRTGIKLKDVLGMLEKI